jgi:hypothetical protein
MSLRRAVAVLVAAASAAPLAAQVRTTQPPIISIFRESEKPGHFAAHEADEVRWTALNREHNYPYTYLALSAVSGTSEVWWVTAYDGMAGWGKGTTWGGDNAAYTASLAKIAAADGEHLTNSIAMQAMALPDASYGAYPDMAKQRVYQVTTFQVRPGNEMAFTAMAKQYAAIMKAKNVANTWRSYEVIAGAPAGTILVFSSYPSWDAVEAMQKATDQAMATSAESEALGKMYRETVVGVNTRYFNVNPRVSLVPKEYLSDPFWAAKP